MWLTPELRTARLLLRSWRVDDAAPLRAALEENQAHIAPWIPAHVAEAAPLPLMEQRLARSASAFTANREWRFGMFLLEDGSVLGEMSLFPRSAEGRVSLADADRVEIGYWIRADATNRGLVTEAARALLDAADAFGVFSHVEIRCDARNARSGAVARRLGFTLQPPAEGDEEFLEVWTLDFAK